MPARSTFLTRDYSAAMDIPDGYRSPVDDALGVKVTEASGDRVVAELDVSERLHQPNGIVHGGVYATIVETTASVGATLWLDGDGVAVGVSNHTDFLRSVRDGSLRAQATPVQQGRTMQLWRVDVTDDAQRPVAAGTVRLMNLREG